MSRRRNPTRNVAQDTRNGFDEWGGYMEAKKSKLHEQYEKRTLKNVKKESDIFKGISIFVNGLTNPNIDELRDLMAAHGGNFHLYQLSSTTHIIASNLPNVKINKLGSVPIVKPSWITDSIYMGKLLDYRRYLLYTNQTSTQPKIDFSNLPINSPRKVESLVLPPESETSKLPPKTKSPLPPKTVSLLPPKTESSLPAKTASDPKFLEEFYNNSRLHLISTLRDEFKQLVSDLRGNKRDNNFPGRQKLLNLSKSRNTDNVCITGAIIMHIDMDCFFVSVGVRNRPELKGQPVAVTHARNAQLAHSRNTAAVLNGEFPSGPGSPSEVDDKSSMSEIASCSYEARNFGIKNGMFLGTAIKMCPNLKTIPYDFNDYKEVSHILYNTIANYTLNIEAVSCDEMYVDITEILKDTGVTVDEFAAHLRSEIMEITGCPCSAGFGANRLQARLATKRAKPCGQFYLQTNDVENYFAEIPLSELPGVGYSTVAKLKNLGLNNCNDVQLFDLETLKRELGPKNGETIFEMSRGIDRKPLSYSYERKSVSAEINYGIRFKTIEECYNFFKSLSVEVYSRLIETNLRAKCLTLKLMIRAADAPVETAKFLGHGICDHISKSTSLTIQDSETVYREVRNIFDKLNVDFKDLRGIGVQLSKLEKIPQINKALESFLKLPSKTDGKYRKIENEDNKKIENKDNKKNENKNNKVENKETRKRKHKDNKNNKKETLNDFFKVARSSSSQEQQKAVQNRGTKIDFDVLTELPDDLRQEIIKEYNINITDYGRNKTENLTQKEETATKCNFDKMNLDQMRKMINEWMQKETEPSEIDVSMLGEHFKNLAINREIEQLRIIFNFLHRKMSLLGCKWHSAYFSMLNLAQEGMVARYGATLFVNRTFICCTLD